LRNAINPYAKINPFAEDLQISIVTYIYIYAYLFKVNASQQKNYVRDTYSPRNY